MWNMAREDIKVLVVDDIDLYREGMVRRLGRSGYTQVQEAEDGKQALEVTDSYRPQLIVMDTDMPNMSGLDACRLIRQEEYGGDIAIIGISVAPNVNEVERAWKKAGADDFLDKLSENFSDTLSSKVKAALEKYGHEID